MSFNTCCTIIISFKSEPDKYSYQLVILLLLVWPKTLNGLAHGLFKFGYSSRNDVDWPCAYGISFFARLDTRL